MHKIKTWRNPYDEGFSTCRRKEVEFQPGLTVLVGCNGSGKSTMLKNIKEELHKEKIPMFFYNNEHDGGSNSIGESVFLGDINFAATAWTSSEGENITLNLSKIASKWRNFILTGEVNDVSTKFAKSFREACDCDIDNKKITSKKRFILLDAMDSGYSIDNVIEMKSLFDLVLEDSEKMGMETYIIVSSNEYELACDTDCFDVTEGKYINFSSYEDFKKFILHTRKKKDKRYK